MEQGQPLDNQEPLTGQESVEPQDGSTPEPERIFVGGRQRTLNEVVEGYEQSTQESIRWRAKAEALEAEMARRHAPPPEPDSPAWMTDAVAAGLPETVARDMASWMDARASSKAEEIAAGKMQELLTSLSAMAAADAESDAVLASDPQMSGYNKPALDALLAQNPSFKARYDRIFSVDPEGAKRLAWVTLRGEAKPRGGSRMTQPPVNRRAMAPAEGEKKLADLMKAAREGHEGPLRDLMAAKLAKFGS